MPVKSPNQSKANTRVNQSSAAANKTKLSNASDPRYRKPFSVGWKRELVLRSQSSANKGGDVYYIAPLGKKCRSRVEILPLLTSEDGLDINDFYWSREPLGLSAEFEIIRSAKPQTPMVKKPVNFLDLAEPDPTLGFGKRIPKPKMPKGASPPPSAHKTRVRCLLQMLLTILFFFFTYIGFTFNSNHRNSKFLKLLRNQNPFLKLTTNQKFRRHLKPSK